MQACPYIVASCAAGCSCSMKAHHEAHDWHHPCSSGSAQPTQQHSSMHTSPNPPQPQPPTTNGSSSSNAVTAMSYMGWLATATAGCYSASPLQLQWYTVCHISWAQHIQPHVKPHATKLKGCPAVPHCEHFLHSTHPCEHHLQLHLGCETPSPSRAPLPRSQPTAH